MLIDYSEIRRHKSYDANGYVFAWRDGIYRAIYPGRQEWIRKLWDSGLIQELIDLGLFPRTRLTDFETDDSTLVFEHEKIHVISYPPEWSFLMLREAALTTLRVNLIARKYGLQTIDAHGFNIAFHNGRALFIDLGSFVEIANDFNCRKPGWRAYGEFIRSFYAPLQLWSSGDAYLARKALQGEQMSMVDYWRYRSRLLRLVPGKFLARFEYAWHKFKALNTVPVSEFRRIASVSDAREQFAGRVERFSKRRGLPFSSVNLERLQRKVAALKPPRIATAWAEYHQDREPDDRHRFVVDTIRRLRPASVLDMAGNAGFFAKAVAAVDGVDYVICADYDVNAIDHLFSTLADFEHCVYPAVLNFSITISDSKFPPETERYKADLVMALALTHHLLLTQNLTIDFVLSRLDAFSKRYVAVEFMPMGLFSSDLGKVPEVPDWYHQRWFRQQFCRYFRLLEEKEIDRNRIIFVGEKLPER